MLFKRALTDEYMYSWNELHQASHLESLSTIAPKMCSFTILQAIWKIFMSQANHHHQEAKICYIELLLWTPTQLTRLAFASIIMNYAGLRYKHIQYHWSYSQCLSIDEWNHRISEIKVSGQISCLAKNKLPEEKRPCNLVEIQHSHILENYTSLFHQASK